MHISKFDLAFMCINTHTPGMRPGHGGIVSDPIPIELRRKLAGIVSECPEFIEWAKQFEGFDFDVNAGECGHEP